MASGNGISVLLNFKNFRGRMPPDPPSDWRLRRASPLPPRTQISSYGHAVYLVWVLFPGMATAPCGSLLAPSTLVSGITTKYPATVSWATVMGPPSRETGTRELLMGVAFSRGLTVWRNTDNTKERKVDIVPSGTIWTRRYSIVVLSQQTCPFACAIMLTRARIYVFESSVFCPKKSKINFQLKRKLNELNTEWKK